MWIKHLWYSVALYVHVNCKKVRYAFRCIYCLEDVPDTAITLHSSTCKLTYHRTRRRRLTLYRCIRCYDLHSSLQLLTPPRDTCAPFLWDVAPAISPAVSVLWWEKTMTATPRIPHQLLLRHRRWFNRHTQVWESYYDLYGEWLEMSNEWLYHTDDGIFFH